MPAMTQQQCQLPMKADEGPQPPMEPGCTILESKKVGNKYTFKYACDNAEGKYTGSGEMETAKDSYKGVMRTEGMRGGKPMNATMKIAAKKIGTCDYVDQKKQADEMIAGAKAQQQASMDKMCAEAIDNLQPQMIFPGPEVPPEAQFCKDKKPAYCAKVKSVYDSMNNPKTYNDAMGKYSRQTLAESGKLCGLDIAATRGAACNKAVSTSDYLFLRGNCKEEVAKLRAGKCDVPGKLSEADQTMCDNLGGMDYTAINAKKGNAKPQPGNTSPSDASSAAQSTSNNQQAPAGDKPAEPAKSSSGATDKLKEGADKLKKFLKF